MEFNCNELGALFVLPTEDDSASNHEVEEVVSSTKEKKASKKGGRPSVVSKFPQIPAVSTAFIKNNGYKAQEKQWV